MPTPHDDNRDAALAGDLVHLLGRIHTWNRALAVGVISLVVVFVASQAVQGVLISRNTSSNVRLARSLETSRSISAAIKALGPAIDRLGEVFGDDPPEEYRSVRQAAGFLTTGAGP